MGRGKIEIKKIENPTNRQVTYSQIKNGIFKKAQELNVPCDAKVSIIMFSNSGKFHEYIRPDTTQRKGEDLNDMCHKELYGLQQKMDASLEKMRKRKVRNLEQRHGNHLLDFRYPVLMKEAKCEDPYYGMVDDDRDYDSAVAFANGVSNLYAFRLHPDHPNLQHGGGLESHKLRLA